MSRTMSRYRLSFLDALAGQPTAPTFAPRRTVWYGTEADLLAAKQDRTKRVYLVLLTEANVPYTMEPAGGILTDGKTDMGLVAQLWNDANVLVTCGRDLQ